MNKKSNKKGIKIKIIYSFILLFITFSLFVGGTFAWFTNTAVVKGNKIFAGNLYVDVIVDRDGLTNAGYDMGSVDTSGDIATIDGIDGDVPLYKREFSDDVSSETYFTLTDLTAPFLTLYNVEPGQAFLASFGVLNSGDLAIKYSAGFRIGEDSSTSSGLQSYTGLETLERQKDPTNENFKVFHNGYSVSNNVIDFDDRPTGTELSNLLSAGLTDDEYALRKEKLVDMQTDSTKVEGSEGWDLGGHLEDVLEVYAVDSLSRDSNGKPTRNAVSSHNYIGTIRQIIDALDPTVDKTPELLAVERRLNSTAVGYCLPIETVADDSGKFLKNGVEVKVYNDEGEVTGKHEHVSEIGTVDYVIYMPDDADNTYQNAALFLDLGVTATQVEFEFDDMGCMIYDKSETVVSIRVGNVSKDPNGSDYYHFATNMDIRSVNELTADVFADGFTLNVDGVDMTLHQYTFDAGNGNTFDYLSFYEGQIMYVGDPFMYFDQISGRDYSIPVNDDSDYTVYYDGTLANFLRDSEGQPLTTNPEYYNENEGVWADAILPNHRYKDKVAIKMLADLYDMNNSPEDKTKILTYLQFLDEEAHLILTPNTPMSHGGLVLTITNPVERPSSR